MKRLKNILCFITVLCLCLSIAPSAFATEADGAELTGEKSRMDRDYENLSWDELVADFIASYGLEDWQVMLGYRNLVTGEEHFVNPDRYTDAASTYKVPLNMIYAEKIANGEMELESSVWAYEYWQLLHGTIIDSNNEQAEVLWTYLGGYDKYRHMITEYMGEDPETVDPKFYVNNYITARQALTCLVTLYENPDRFPYIIDKMKEAEPTNYFRAYENRFEIAHKYGYNFELNHFYYNDTAIVYTDEPIAIVFYSDNVYQGLDMMARYCTLMCDYTQYHSGVRIAAQKAAEEEAARAAAEAEAKAEAETAAKEAAEIPVGTPLPAAEEDNNMSLDLSTFILFALSGAAAVFVLIKVIINHRKVGPLFGFLTAAFMLLTLCVCIYGYKAGTVYAPTEGDPNLTTSRFFDSVTKGNYSEAYSCLDGYSSLGLENRPNSEAAALIHKALTESYSYQLASSASVDGLAAKQSVDFSYLDLSEIDRRVQLITPDKIEEIVETHSRSEVYDDNNEYRPEITELAYITALKEVLENSQDCRKTVRLDLTLNYINRDWLIVPDAALFKALLGGISY